MQEFHMRMTLTKSNDIANPKNNSKPKCADALFLFSPHIAADWAAFACGRMRQEMSRTLRPLTSLIILEILSSRMSFWMRNTRRTRMNLASRKDTARSKKLATTTKKSNLFQPFFQ
eukprot:scaffold680617_cov31-Prasinocladus_malaysianus.AAC.1